MRRRSEANGFARGDEIRRFRCMGAKYLPSIKDQKAAQRFQQKQSPMPQFKKPAPKKRRK